ncbi:MAG TPA: CGNR zinc finger domain-containing protein [Actinomycetota bacterium]|nr:CGNR zinc finger domain-containing protein [Actinomycetota bacterium]
MFDINQHLSASPPAPGDLEILQRFLNLHDHAPDGETLEPPLEMVRAFLVERGLLAPEQRFTEADRETYLELRRALRALIEADDGEALAPTDAEVIDRLGADAGLHPHFHAEHRPTLEPRGAGVAAALGRIVAIAFVASFDGSFEHLKLCASEDCRAVFYDRSKNHSGRWCSMETCGNRAKVRAWRERQRATS